MMTPVIFLNIFFEKDPQSTKVSQTSSQNNDKNIYILGIIEKYKGKDKNEISKNNKLIR